MSQAALELAYYYPNPMWLRGDWIKNLILFFDGVALLVPEYMHDQPLRIDPAIVSGLEQHGLLKILEPETFVDQQTAQGLAEAMTNILVSGALDKLASETTQFAELSYSRLGYGADAGLAQMILDDLIKRGLARTSEDGVSIPMHPMVRSLILVLLAQLLRPVGKKHGLDLYPATDNPRIHSALGELLALPTMPSAGHVISSDLEAVGVDLGPIPIDEILDFRAQHRRLYQRYVHDLRRFVRELGQLSVEEQREELKARQAELTDQTEQLRSISLSAWRKPVSLGLGIAGAIWQVTQGDVIGGLFALSSGIIGAQGAATNEAGAFSYLLKARTQFE